MPSQKAMRTTIREQSLDLRRQLDSLAVELWKNKTALKRSEKLNSELHEQNHKLREALNRTRQCAALVVVSSATLETRMKAREDLR